MWLKKNHLLNKACLILPFIKWIQTASNFTRFSSWGFQPPQPPTIYQTTWSHVRKATLHTWDFQQLLCLVPQWLVKTKAIPKGFETSTSLDSWNWVRWYFNIPHCQHLVVTFLQYFSLSPLHKSRHSTLILRIVWGQATCFAQFWTIRWAKGCKGRRQWRKLTTSWRHTCKTWVLLKGWIRRSLKPTKGQMLQLFGFGIMSEKQPDIK